MHRNTEMLRRRGSTPRNGVRCHDDRFVTCPIEVLENPQHRVGDAVDVREEGFRDDGYSHHATMNAPLVGEVRRS